MTDYKKVALTTIGNSKKEKTKKIPKTPRFTIKLTESNEHTFPEYNYRELLGNNLVSKKTDK